MEKAAENTILTLDRLLRRLDIRRSALEIAAFVRGHPLPLSIRCASDLLDAFGVQNMVCRLSYEQLTEIDSPFLAVIRTTTDPLCLILRATATEVRLMTPQGKELRLPKERFTGIWEGIVLLAEKDDGIKEDNPLIFHAKQLLAWIDRTGKYWLGGSIVLLLGGTLLRNAEWADLRYAIKAAGLIVSLLTVIKASLDPRLVQRFCRHGKHSDCNTVFHSAGAKVLGWISLGELSLSYFGASLLWGVFGAGEPAGLFSLLDALALAAVLYSLAWQIRHRQWCRLCLAIDGVLIADFLFELLRTIFEGNRMSTGGIADWLGFGTVFAVCLLATRRIVGMAEENLELPRLRYKRERLLNTPELLWQLLAQQPEAAIDSNEASPISNYEEAEHTITVVMNPSCPKCAKVHEAIGAWEHYRINLIFVVNDQDRTSYDAALRLISSGITSPWPETDKLISEWYRDRRLTGARIHALAGKDLETHLEYCRRTGITGTPTILIDNRRLPDIFDPEDLKYLL